MIEKTIVYRGAPIDSTDTFMGNNKIKTGTATKSVYTLRFVQSLF